MNKLAATLMICFVFLQVTASVEMGLVCFTTLLSTCRPAMLRRHGCNFAACKLLNEEVAPPALRRLAEISNSHAGQSSSVNTDNALRTALAGISLLDFGLRAAGWARCYRSTRIVIQEDEMCSISVLLLPAGECLAPYSRPGASVFGFAALKGSVGVRAFLCGNTGEGATLAKGLPENGLHDPRSLAALTNKNGCITPQSSQSFEEPDCVCRGGVCPRREGCNFWVELMRERLQRTKASTATCSDEEISAQSAALLMPAGSRRLVQFFAGPKDSAFLLEVAYKLCTEDRERESSPGTVQWHRVAPASSSSAASTGSASEGLWVTVPLLDRPENTPRDGVWTGPKL